MIIELHMLQNFAPSCLNRDDTNAPKSCVFGGVRRARISSQCLKRAIRLRLGAYLNGDDLSVRTKMLYERVGEILNERGRPLDEATSRTRAALQAIKIAEKSGDDTTSPLTQYLLFVGQREITALAELVDKHWNELGAVAAVPAKEAAATEVAASDAPEEQQVTSAGRKKQGLASRRDAKNQARNALSPDLQSSVKALFNGGKAVDLALFGRMLADQPDLNREAACQVANAISTHSVSTEMDFYTAVDDLQTRTEHAGAGMMGIVEFNSACYYRYANIDYRQLVANLQGDRDLARQGIAAFLRAAVEAIPTGKQNSMAAHNPPSLVFAVVREAGAWSLANAFERPVWPVSGQHASGLIEPSIEALDAYWRHLCVAYGDRAMRAAAVCRVGDAPMLHALEGYRKATVDEVFETVLRALLTPEATP